MSTTGARLLDPIGITFHRLANSIHASNFFSVLIDTFSDREFMYSYAISNWSMVNVDVERVESDQIRPLSFFYFILSLLI